MYWHKLEGSWGSLLWDSNEIMLNPNQHTVGDTEPSQSLGFLKAGLVVGKACRNLFCAHLSMNFCFHWICAVGWWPPCPHVLSFSSSSLSTSLVAQVIKTPPAMRETWIQSLGWEDPLEKGKATHSSSGEFPGLYTPWGRKELDTSERRSLSFSLFQVWNRAPFCGLHQQQFYIQGIDLAILKFWEIGGLTVTLLFCFATRLFSHLLSSSRPFLSLFSGSFLKTLLD